MLQIWNNVKRLTLEKFKIIFEIGAVLVAAYWTYQQFNIESPDSPNLIVNITATPITTKSNETILLIDVSLKNVGKTKIRPGKHPKGEDCELEVIKYTRLSGHMEGNAKPYHVIDWNMNGGIYEKIVDKFNLLRYYNNYTINAGVEMHERVLIPVDPGYIYGIKARFFNENWSAADFQYINVSPPDTTDKPAKSSKNE